MRLEEALSALEAARPAGTLAVSANGYISRALFKFDRPGNFYMLGSMGLASPIALGAAVSLPGKKVVVYDGDGNLLMNLSALAIASALSLPNFRHVVLDNGEYASTGGQPTHARTADLARLAEAAGYRRVLRCAERASDSEGRERARELFSGEGPALLHLRLARGAEKKPPGARVTHAPEEIRDRFAAAARAGEEPPP